MNRASPATTTSRLATFAWLFVLYLLGVILFGAWVRITGSGAGCGNHWPTCHGQIIPAVESRQTLIEFTHRVTSGLCGLFGLALIAWAWARHGASRVFYAALVTMAFIVIEALIGAKIVLAELVADDDSVARAIVIAMHLVNTLVLMAAASLTAWWAGQRPEQPSARRLDRLDAALLCFGALCVIVTSMSGAITALGDTLFPIDPTLGEGLMARVRDDLSATKHFLVRLRVMHPVLAVLSSLYLLWLSSRFIARERASSVRRFGVALSVAIASQLALGLLNIALAAPGWIQLLHLLLAQGVWIALVLLCASALAAPSSLSSSAER